MARPSRAQAAESSRQATQDDSPRSRCPAPASSSSPRTKQKSAVELPVDVPFRESYASRIVAAMTDYQSTVESDLKKVYAMVEAAGLDVAEREIEDEELRQELNQVVMDIDDLRAKMVLTVRTLKDMDPLIKYDPERTTRLADDLQTLVGDAHAQYEAKSRREKYLESPYYRTYRERLHEVTNPDEEDFAWQSILANEDRAQQSGGGNGSGGGNFLGRGEGGEEDDEEEDIIIGRATQSDKCLLTLVHMTEPYRSKKCGHRFQKEAIIHYIQTHLVTRRTGAAPCPQPGCPARFTLNDFELDHSFIRRQRIIDQRRREQEEEEGDAAGGAASQRDVFRIREDGIDSVHMGADDDEGYTLLT